MEDVIPFVLAKKLKDDGVTIPCIGHYHNEKFSINHEHKTLCFNNDIFTDYVDAPTIYQVLKYYREEKKIAINISFVPHTWQYVISDMEFNSRFDDYGRIMYTSYEEAAIDAIKKVRYYLKYNTFEEN